MSTGDRTPVGPPIDLGKEPPRPPSPAGPAWIVVPARVVALVVFLPVRLVYDLLVLIGRGVRAVWNALMRVPVWIGRMLYRWLLAPFGRLLAAIARGLGALLHLLLVRPLVWLAVVFVLTPLRWVYRVLLTPIGRGLVWLLTLAGRCLAWLFRVFVVVPAVFLWRYVLRPPLLFLAWLGRGVVAVLAAIGGLIAAGWRAFAGAVAWTGRLVGRCLAWLARVLVVLPVQAVWRYVLAPIGAAVAWAWRLAARGLRWLWRVLVVVPVRVLVVAPARWVGTAVLRPIGRGVRETWRVCVRQPLRAVRDAGRDVRLQLRRTFRGY